MVCRNHQLINGFFFLPVTQEFNNNGSAKQWCAIITQQFLFVASDTGVQQDDNGSAEQWCAIITQQFLFIASDTGVQQDNNRSAEQRRATSATQAGGVGAESVPSDTASVPHEAGNHGHHQQPSGVACFWGDWFRKNHAGDHRSMLLWKTKVGENYWD